jgi:hypothetical protein
VILLAPCLPRFPIPALLHSFDDLPDPRVSARCAYPLQELLLVALCAVTCGTDDWVNVALWCAFH